MCNLQPPRHIPSLPKTEVSGLARHVRFTLRSRHRQPAPACPFGAAGSTGRRNTGVKSLRWGFKLQGLTGSFVELTSHFVQIGL
jgi:hypothetical protein